MTDVTETKPLYFDLEKVLPQAHPMILIDEIIAYGDEFAMTLVRPEVGKPFADDNGCIPAWIGLEYMAQTIGAYAGIQSQLADKAIKIGFLLGTRSYDLSLDEFCCGKTYWIRAEKIYESDGLSSFDCTIEQPEVGAINTLRIGKIIKKENNVARAIINAYQPNDIKAFMELQKK